MHPLSRRTSQNAGMSKQYILCLHSSLSLLVPLRHPSRLLCLMLLHVMGALDSCHNPVFVHLMTYMHT